MAVCLHILDTSFGYRVSFQANKYALELDGQWLHHTVSVLYATELFSSKWLILFSINFISIKNFFKRTNKIPTDPDFYFSLGVSTIFFSSNENKYIKPQPSKFVQSKEAFSSIYPVSGMSNRVTDSLNQETTMSDCRPVVPPTQREFQSHISERRTANYGLLTHP